MCLPHQARLCKDCSLGIWLESHEHHWPVSLWCHLLLILHDSTYMMVDQSNWIKERSWSSQHSTAQHSTAQYSTAQHSTAQHSTAQHSTAQHSTAQHSTAQHSTAVSTAQQWAQHSSKHSTAQAQHSSEHSTVVSTAQHSSEHSTAQFSTRPSTYMYHTHRNCKVCLYQYVV